jgi:hypothetical protein
MMRVAFTFSAPGAIIRRNVAPGGMNRQGGYGAVGHEVRSPPMAFNWQMPNAF